MACTTTNRSTYPHLQQ